jgi:hypothetical protein
VHGAELQPAGAGRDGHRVRPLLDARPQVEHLEDAVERDQRAHHVDPDVAERGQRPVQPGEQQRHGDHGAGGDAAGDREPATQPVGQCLRERGDQQHRDEEGAGEHGLLDADVADPLGALAEPGRLGLGPAEQLDQQRAGDVEPLGHGRVHLRVQVVRLAGDLGQLLAHPARRHDEQRQHDQRQHGDLPGQAEHHRGGEHQLDDVADHPGQGGGERALGAGDVVVEPADQGAGLGTGEELQRHPLHVVIHPGAQVEDDALADARGIPPLGQREERVDHGQPGDHQGQPDDQRCGVGAAAGDRVDDVPGQHRGGHADAGREHDGDQEDRDVRAVRPREPHDAPGRTPGQPVLSDLVLVADRPQHRPTRPAAGWTHPTHLPASGTSVPAGYDNSGR